MFTLQPNGQGANCYLTFMRIMRIMIERRDYVHAVSRGGTNYFKRWMAI